MPTTYKIEVTKTNKPKSGYKIRWSGMTPSNASIWWRGLNIGNGYKARLVNQVTGEVVARKG